MIKKRVGEKMKVMMNAKNGEQTELFRLEIDVGTKKKNVAKNGVTSKKNASVSGKETIPAQNIAPKGKKPVPSFTKEPATAVMKAVAKNTADERKMAKVFSSEEIEEILAKRENGGRLDPGEAAKIRRKYRQIKSQVKELESGNKSKLYIFPSLTTGGDWYKLIDFSALYYIYRLAPRMGRKGRIYPDSDKNQKALYTASLQNIESFLEHFKKLETSEVEMTEDGVYICTLKRPLTDEELILLRGTRERERDKMHTVMKPKNMDPAIFQQILLLSRQLLPRAKKLNRDFYNTTGEGLVFDVQKLLATYFDYSCGLIKKDELEKEITRIANRMTAGITILSENNIWQYDIATVIGMSIADLKRLVAKNLRKI